MNLITKSILLMATSAFVPAILIENIFIQNVASGMAVLSSAALIVYQHSKVKRIDDVIDNIELPKPKPKKVDKVDNKLFTVDTGLFKKYNVVLDSPKKLNVLANKILSFYKRYDIVLKKGKDANGSIRTNELFFKIPINTQGKPISVSSISNKIIDLQRVLGGKQIVFNEIVANSDNISFIVQRDTKNLVGLGNVFETKEYKKLLGDRNKHGQLLTLPISLGIKSDGQYLNTNIQKMVHSLTGGKSGSGKTMFLRSVIANLLSIHSADTLEIIVIDTKMVDFQDFAGCVTLVTDATEAEETIKTLVTKMEFRYKTLSLESNINAVEYNKGIKSSDHYMKNIVVIIDEYADLVAECDKSFTKNLVKLLQKSRASNIYTFIGTQRCSTDIIDGSIKANTGTRIAFQTSSITESNIIMDQSGAEKLTGEGAGICKLDGNMIYFQSFMVSRTEIGNLVKGKK